MPDPEETKQRDEPEATKDQGCPIAMYGGKPCGRPLHKAVYPGDRTNVCLMHTHDPSKDDVAFQAEFERILRDAGEGCADFSGFVFPSANYAEREFKAECIFAETTFTHDAYFFGARFMRRASFHAARFAQGVVFFGVTFNQVADFNQAAFERGAEFSNAIFADDAFFIGVGFEGSAHFSRATFANAAFFSGATFTRDADFSGATFTQRADFGEATFKERAIFRETVFRKDEDRSPGPVFSDARFEKPDAVTFYKTYLGQALFHNCDVSKFVFSTVRWRRRSNGKSMVFEEYIDLEHDTAGALGPEQHSPDERNYSLIAELYQQLKKNYDDRRDYWTAGDFHYGEMEMKRLACPRLTWLAWLEAKLSGKPRLRKLGGWCRKLESNPWLLSRVRWWHQRFGLAAWYRRASDYGESWGKPLLWLFAVLALFAALYPLLGLRPAAGRSPAAKTTSVQVQTPSPQETDLRYWNYERPGRLFWHTVMTSLGVAAFQRDLAYEPSYPWGRLLALLELLLTFTLIALFLLAVRRQFRR